MLPLLHGDISHTICMLVEASCLGRLAVACRGFVSDESWLWRAEQLWPGLAEAGAAGARVHSRTAPFDLFRALYLGRVRTSSVDVAAAERLSKEPPEYSAPIENSVLLTIFHGAQAIWRGTATISQLGAVDFPARRNGEQAQFKLGMASCLQKIIDMWFDAFVMGDRSRQLLLTCEIGNPFVLAELGLSVMVQVWTWPNGVDSTPCVVCPSLPLTLVEKDDISFQLHFVHLPFPGSCFDDCLDLAIEVEASEGQASADATAYLRGRVSESLHLRYLLQGYLSSLSSLL
eukprot:TRINITY_DN95312_c0_g1_i1.p1 TRINITY_DN95312_c0_g1~~TRINITY_DN95312_c0_g1_i1.p1  ORF type:complete len:288 (-),score=54.51 TRINITY_DN95312_c0_g1_i1:43-906(-)